MKTAIKVCITLALVWFGGVVAFIYSCQQPPLDITTHTDAIVVLTGGRDRISTAYELLEAGLAQKLFISGVDSDVQIEHLDPRFERNDPRIVLGYEALTTVGNALEVAKWVKANQINSMRLVTANYHIYRSLIEMRRFLDPNILIISHPVFPELSQRFSGVSAYVWIREYHKFILSNLRSWVR